MAQEESSMLPSIDGKYLKPKSKSTDRHRREAAYKAANEANKMVGTDYSVTTWRRLEFVFKYGSEETKKALDLKQISIWRAYNIAKQEAETRAMEWARSHR